MRISPALLRVKEKKEKQTQVLREERWTPAEDSTEQTSLFQNWVTRAHTEPSQIPVMKDPSKSLGGEHQSH